MDDVMSIDDWIVENMEECITREEESAPNEPAWMKRAAAPCTEARIHMYSSKHDISFRVDWDDYEKAKKAYKEYLDNVESSKPRRWWTPELNM